MAAQEEKKETKKGQEEENFFQDQKRRKKKKKKLFHFKGAISIMKCVKQNKKLFETVVSGNKRAA